MLLRPLTGLRLFWQWLTAEHCFYAKLLGSSLAGIVAIILLAGIFLIATDDAAAPEHSRAQALDTLRSLGKIENDLKGLESAHRDFLLRGEENARENFQISRISLETRLAALRGDTQASSETEAALADFASCVQ